MNVAEAGSLYDVLVFIKAYSLDCDLKWLIFVLLIYSVHNLSQTRRLALERSLKFYQFLQDSEEEEAWLVERISLAKSQDVGKDLVMCLMLIKRHEVHATFTASKYQPSAWLRDVIVGWKTVAVFTGRCSMRLWFLFRPLNQWNGLLQGPLCSQPL